MIDPPAVRDALKRHRKLKGVGSPAGTTLISPTMLSSTSGLVPLKSYDDDTQAKLPYQVLSTA